VTRALVALVAGVVSLSAASASASAAVTSDLAAPDKKEIAMELVSSAENSSLDWRAQYRYIQDIDDGRGYTAGIIGFTSRTGDMLQVVRAYTRAQRHNPLRKFVPALKRAKGSDSHRALGRRFIKAWRKAARDPVFQTVQDDVRDTVYFNPSVALAKADGLDALGQFCYYDAAVMHGFNGMSRVRARALARAAAPAAGGDEAAYLGAYLDERVVEMLKERSHKELGRVEAEQRKFLREGNLDLHLPLTWGPVYPGDPVWTI
jgi:chitosanase